MSAIHHFKGGKNAFDWQDAVKKEYPEGIAKGAKGKVIIGNQDNAKHFVFRYFQIEPGGYSAIDDTHEHDHGIYILHGRALAHLGGKVEEVGPNDVIYIEPWMPHHLETLGDEPLGFLCIIPNKDMLNRLKEIHQKPDAEKDN